MEDDITLPSAKFQIYSGILKSSRDADGKMRLHGVASSTTKDLHGDTMAESALEDMERAAANNLTIFLNHSYDVPEDVAGSVEGARMKTRGVDGAGNPNKDLDMDILINEANPRAVKAFEAIERGTKLGLSIGALIPEGGARKDKSSGSYIIEHVDLLETSLVGIPANPRSWVEYAAKSLRGVEKDATAVPIGTPTLTLDGNNYTITGTVNSSSTTFLQNGTTDQVVTDAATCPTCGKGKSAGGDCSNPFHSKDIEPELTDSKITLIEIDTGDGSSESDSSSDDASASQEANSDPGTGDEEYAAPPVDVVASMGLTEEQTKAFGSFVAQLQTTVSELVVAKQQVVDLTKERDDAVRERDVAKETTAKIATETHLVLTNLANTPLMRRAVVVDAQQSLNERYKSVYSEDVLKILGVETNG